MNSSPRVIILILNNIFEMIDFVIYQRVFEVICLHLCIVPLSRLMIQGTDIGMNQEHLHMNHHYTDY